VDYIRGITDLPRASVLGDVQVHDSDLSWRRVDLEELVDCRRAIAGAGCCVLAERDPLQLGDVLGAPGLRWRLLVSGLSFDRRGDLRELAIELPRDARPMVQETAGFAVLVDEAPLVEIAIDCLEDGHAPCCLLDGDALRDRELERLGEAGGDLRRSRLDEAFRINAVLHSVRVARMGSDERSWISVFVHGDEYAAGHHAAINEG